MVKEAAHASRKSSHGRVGHLRDAMSGDAKDQCRKNAKAAHDKAMADAEASHDKAKADYEAHK